MSVGDDMQDTIEQLEHVMTRLAWLQRRLFLRGLSPYGLTLPQFIVLDQIARYDQGEQMKMGELADMARQCAPTITGIVDRLVRMGLVTRMRSPSDRRQVLASLTPRGREVWQQITSARRKALRRRLERFGGENTADILRLAKAYLELIERELAEDTNE